MTSGETKSESKRSIARFTARFIEGEPLMQAAQDSYAQALLVEAELLAATLPGLWEQHGEAQAALEQAQASSTEVQIRVREQAIQRLERISSLRTQVVQRLRQQGERVLAALRAEEKTCHQHLQA